MERLWAPWRMEYILGEQQPGCIFCIDQAGKSDRDLLVLYRTPLSLVMLNRYPYTNGHLLVAPCKHTADMDSLSHEELLDLFVTMRICKNILQKEVSPQGFNIGINLGKVAGAGVADHLHLHIVPRWSGDTNFMSVLDDIRVMPEHLHATYDQLYPAFSSYDR